MTPPSAAVDQKKERCTQHADTGPSMGKDCADDTTASRQSFAGGGCPGPGLLRLLRLLLLLLPLVEGAAAANAATETGRWEKRNVPDRQQNPQSSRSSSLPS